MAKYKQGYYTPKHPEKYVGDISKIRYMSSWELSVHKFLDNNSRVLRWSSEEISIPYIKPTDNKVHRYFPDYWVEYVTAEGEVMQEILEVKPLAQTKQSKAKNPKYRLYEQLTFAVNTAKWQYAEAWCQQHNMKFRIISENSIFR